MIMASCVIGMMYHISEEFDEFLKIEVKKRKIPIPGKHAGLFMILLNFNNKLEFKDIADIWKKSKSTLCDIITKYESEGLLEREQCCLDKRNVFVKLTPKGIEYASIFDGIALAYLEKATVGISEEQKENVKDVLQAMMKNLK